MPPSDAGNDMTKTAIQQAITNAISTQYTTSVEIRPLPPGPIENDLPWLYAQISLLRDAPGNLVLGASKATLTKVAQRYLPSDVILNDEWIGDLLCETLNVIAGQLKTLLKETPLHFRLTTPRLILSDEFRSAEKTWFEVLTEEGTLIFGADI